MNEGHAAFLVLERVRARCGRDSILRRALEAVAASSVFTTHTAVAAGHDHFGADMMARAFRRAIAASVGIDRETLLALGRSAEQQRLQHDGARGARLALSQRRLQDPRAACRRGCCTPLWPEIPPPENPIDHVTNGVHVRTFLALEWFDLFERFLGHDWTRRLASQRRVGRHRPHPRPYLLVGPPVPEVADAASWCASAMREQHLRNQGSEAHLDRLLRYADPDNPNVLTVGFGRRFATYKRATLLFQDLDWLREIIGGPRPPGAVHLRRPRTSGRRARTGPDPRNRARGARCRNSRARSCWSKVTTCSLRRQLVTGVDVWLNNPIYPLEASGTSGMKAGMNGVINLSVLDGWWGEGYRHGNGWAIKPAPRNRRRGAPRRGGGAHALRNPAGPRAAALLRRAARSGYSPGWIRMAKHRWPRPAALQCRREWSTSIVAKFYRRAAAAGSTSRRRRMRRRARFAAWKARVRAAWPGVTMRRHRRTPIAHHVRRAAWIEVGRAAERTRADDVAVELLLARAERETDIDERSPHR